MTAQQDITCLLSHKCNDESHELGRHLRAFLAPLHIKLEIDPFSTGHDVNTRMQTFDIEAVILLATIQSVQSEAVQLELKAAARQGLPIFTIHLEGELPSHLKKRSLWRMPALGTEEFVAGVQQMGESVRERVMFHRKLQRLYPDNYYEEMVEAARSIAEEEERTLVAEYACELVRRCQQISNPSTSYWVAIALGRVDTVQAVRLLDRLPLDDHPLVREGIRQAKAMIRHHGTSDRSFFSN